MIHFSGHGALLDGEFYLLPYGVMPVMRWPSPPPHCRRPRCASSSKAWPSTAGSWCCWMPAARAGPWPTVRPWWPTPPVACGAGGGNITVLTSSSKDELSREDPQWGNGAFTKIVLEALSSKADANRNGLISISELTGYLTRHVPGLTDGAQHPGVEMRFDGDVFVAGL